MKMASCLAAKPSVGTPARRVSWRLSFGTGIVAGLAGTAFGLSALAVQAPAGSPALTTRRGTLNELRSILNAVPSCSEYLRRTPTLNSGALFFPAMRAAGIARAHFVIGADAVSPAPTRLRILRTIYFSNYDGSRSEVTDPRRLREIETSGLASSLRAMALQEAGASREAYDTAGVRYPTAGSPAARFTADFEVDADTWMPRLPGPYNSALGQFFPDMPGPATAEGAVARQDTMALLSAARSAALGQATLNRLLLLAATSARDSSGVISVLAGLGADPNQLVDSWLGGAPRLRTLTLAVHGSACNVAALLAAGADPNLEDESGHTALELALREGRGDIATLLRSAGAVPK